MSDGRNENARAELKEKHTCNFPVTDEETGRPKPCGKDSFMHCSIGVLQQDGDSFKEWQVERDEIGRVISAGQFSIPFCEAHFTYPLEGVIYAVVDKDGKPAGMHCPVGWETLRIMEVVAHQAILASDMAKKKQEQEEPHE